MNAYLFKTQTLMVLPGRVHLTKAINVVIGQDFDDALAKLRAKYQKSRVEVLEVTKLNDEGPVITGEPDLPPEFRNQYADIGK